MDDEGRAFEPIETERLWLRPFRSEDLDAFVAYRSDPEVARYQPWEDFSEARGRTFIEHMRQARIDSPGTWYQIALELKESGELIGDCGVHTLALASRQVELGFTLARAHQGRGLMSEAVRALLAYLFGGLDKHRAYAVADAANADSIRLLERLGFRREGHFRENIWFKGHWGDEVLYALLASEWRAGRAR